PSWAAPRPSSRWAGTTPCARRWPSAPGCSSCPAYAPARSSSCAPACSPPSASSTTCTRNGSTRPPSSGGSPAPSPPRPPPPAPAASSTSTAPPASPTCSPASSPRRRRPMSPERIGYVLKMYPRFSETFIVSELLGREARGADLEVFSLRPPVDPRFHSALAEVRAPVTYVPRARRPEELWDALRDAAPELPLLHRALPELLAAEASDAGQALALAVMVVRRGITHLHAHFASLATTVARLTSLLTGVPYSLTAHAKDIFHSSVDPA